MRDYNIGVPGFLAVRGGDHLEALYYCGGDEYEREGWCYAQPSLPQGGDSWGGWLPQRLVTAPHSTVTSLAAMPFVPLPGYHFSIFSIPILALLKSLQGSWKDQYGTEYGLSLSEEETTVTVCTRKRQQEPLITKGLIGLADHAPKGPGMLIQWGKGVNLGYRLDLLGAPKDEILKGPRRIAWVPREDRPKLRTFHWHRDPRKEWPLQNSASRSSLSEPGEGSPRPAVVA